MRLCLRLPKSALYAPTQSTREARCGIANSAANHSIWDALNAGSINSTLEKRILRKKKKKRRKFKIKTRGHEMKRTTKRLIKTTRRKRYVLSTLGLVPTATTAMQ